MPKPLEMSEVYKECRSALQDRELRLRELSRELESLGVLSNPIRSQLGEFIERTQEALGDVKLLYGAELNDLALYGELKKMFCEREHAEFKLRFLQGQLSAIIDLLPAGTRKAAIIEHVKQALERSESEQTPFLPCFCHQHTQEAKSDGQASTL